jgi:cellulose synthase/poly-beta-1,6-N-acetylglucosamine synthase-like glycosyltransferase
VLGAVGAAVALVAVLGLGLVVAAVAAVAEVVFVVFFLRHFAFAVSALRSAPRDLRAATLAESGYRPRVSVLVACKNEGSVVEGMIASLLSLDYPKDLLQVVLVDDGSTDRTGEVLDAAAARDARIVCLHRSPDAESGKSAALNDALELVTGEIVVVFDADHHPDTRTVSRLVAHFRDPRVGAVQGRCEIRNADDSPLSRLIAIDYLAGYLVNEYGRQSLFQLPAYGGANCAVRASSLRAAGGWNPRSVTEDTDLTLRLLLAGHRIRYDVNAVDREEGVVTLQRFWRQRYRWARGHQQVCRDYRRQVWSARHLSAWEKVETTMFLYVYHLPVVSALGLVVVLVWSLGLAAPVTPVNLTMFWTLLFLGPLLELGAGLLVSGTERRYARSLAYFLPLFFVSIALCAKAWIDGLGGRPYGWVKTKRAADEMAAA